ncbi:MAG: hypothetical protein Q8R15_03740 [Candidatus Micrarchaeota archaeon]|nr:hypothetical protein [Candidatus Micrarchaeota archaeon]
MAKRPNLTLRTYAGGERRGGFDVSNLPRGRAEMVVRAARKAARDIDPKLEVRSAITSSESRSGKAKVNLPGQAQASSGRKSFGMPNVSQVAWNRIFGKKKKN